MKIIGHYNPSARITIQFLTSLMLYVLILCKSGGTYILNSTPNDILLRSLFMTILVTLTIFASNLPAGSRPINTFSYFVLLEMFELAFEPWSHVYAHYVNIWYISNTYIHNWPLQPFSQDYWPSFSHHLCCVC